MLRQKNVHVIYLAGGIEWTVVQQITESLKEVSPKTKGLILIISSNGGNPDAAWSLYQLLRSLSLPLVTVAIGKVYSAGVIPYLAGTKRYTLPSTIFMFHPTTIEFDATETERTIHQLKDNLRGEEVDDRLFKEALIRAGVTCSAANLLVGTRDAMFIGAEEAQKLGVVTQIIDKLNDIVF